jgi:hypothetical protein
MKIDFQATKQNMVNAGLNLTRWGKLRGFAPPTLLRVLQGRYPARSTGEKYANIINALRLEGYLVESRDETDRSA